ncbi:YciI family protein [Knoellia sp. CPCC 206453]|uniref:YciI family protein n=1 Tax=Knoellia pratensis TaxID=3404796 RepID=UPI003615C5D1
MKRYVFLLAYRESIWGEASVEQQQSWMEDHERFHAFVALHGRTIATAPLASVSDATTVRHIEGQRVVTDGPFAETTETVGGYYDIELPSLDVAIEGAALLPSGYAIEIRPTISMGEAATA